MVRVSYLIGSTNWEMEGVESFQLAPHLRVYRLIPRYDISGSYTGDLVNYRVFELLPPEFVQDREKTLMTSVL
jgi:hypothetical protein